MPTDKSPGLEAAILKAGGVRALARALGIDHSTIVGWRQIPAGHVIAIENLLAIPRRELRPDLYPPPRRPGRPRKAPPPVKRGPAPFKKGPLPPAGHRSR